MSDMSSDESASPSLVPRILAMRRVFVAVSAASVAPRDDFCGGAFRWTFSPRGASEPLSAANRIGFERRMPKAGESAPAAPPARGEPGGEPSGDAHGDITSSDGGVGMPPVGGASSDGPATASSSVGATAQIFL